MIKKFLTMIFILCFFFSQSLVFSQNLSKNKEVVRRYFEEVVNKQKPELVTEIFSEDYFFLSLEDGTEGKGIGGVIEFLPKFFKAIPDIHYTVDQLVAEGDKVVIQLTARGTHKGEIFGYPPMNNKIKISEVFFFTLKNNKIVEGRRLIDLFHMHKQLGGK